MSILQIKARLRHTDIRFFDTYGKYQINLSAKDYGVKLGCTKYNRLLIPFDSNAILCVDSDFGGNL